MNRYKNVDVLYNSTLRINGNEQVTAMYSNRGAFHKCDAERKKPDMEGHTWTVEARRQRESTVLEAGIIINSEWRKGVRLQIYMRNFFRCL